MRRDDEIDEAGRSPLLYQRVGREIASAVRLGRLRAGDRLPSVRWLANQHGISIGTAVQAYRYLEEQRLVEARPKSGFFAAARPRELPEPGLSRPPAAARYVTTPSLLHEYIDALAAAGSMPLGAVIPHYSLFPGQRLARITSSIARRRPELTVAFEAPSVGAPELITELVRRAVGSGWRLDPRETLVTCGTIEALNLALRAVARPGDTIALESPTYFFFLQLIESLGMKVLEVPTHPRTGISPEALELATQREGAVRAVLLIPAFSNPLGSVMPDTHKQRVVEMCALRGVPIIESDVFGDICFAPGRPRPLKAWDADGNVLYCSSFTKSVAPGMRVGWISAGRFQKDVEMLKLSTSMFTLRLPQLVLAEFLASGAYDRHLRRLRAIVAGQALRAADAIADSFPAGTRITRPAGGYVLWVELPERVAAVDVFHRARAERIVVAPGPLFTTSRRFGNCIRISFGQPWSRAVESAIARVGAIAASMM